MLIRGGCANVRPLKITTTTIPYINPDAMVHVLLTLNEPLLQRSAHVAPSVCPSPQAPSVIS
jgi:hypothetical protein